MNKIIEFKDYRITEIVRHWILDKFERLPESCIEKLEEEDYFYHMRDVWTFSYVKISRTISEDKLVIIESGAFSAKIKKKVSMSLNIERKEYKYIYTCKIIRNTFDHFLQIEIELSKA